MEEDSSSSSSPAQIVCEEGICKIPPQTNHTHDDANENKSGVVEQGAEEETNSSHHPESKSQTTAPSQTRRTKETKPVTNKTSIVTLHGQQDLDAFISTNDAVMVEFMTSWCGACKAIEGYYEELSSSNMDFVRSAKVICDKNKQTKKLAAGYNVNSYPVFVAFKDGAVSTRFDGADKGKLESTFERLVGGGGKKKKRGGRSKRRWLE